MREAADQRGAVGRLVLVEAAAVDDARDHLAHVELHLDVARNDAVEFLRVVVRRLGVDALDRELFAAAELGDDLARDRDRLLFVGCRIVRRPRNLRVHVGAAELLDGHDLAGRGLHQRRSAEEDGAGAAHDHIVFAQRRNIGAARGAMADHQRDLRHAHLRQDRLVAEDAPGIIAVGEQFGLRRQEAARAVADVDHRQPVLDGDVQRADDLLDRQRIPGAAFDAGVVGADDDLAARDDADAADIAGARHVAVIVHVGGQRGQLEKRRAGIEQHFDAVAHEHLVLPREPVEVALRPLEPVRDAAVPASRPRRARLCAALARNSSE